MLAPVDQSMLSVRNNCDWVIYLFRAAARPFESLPIKENLYYVKLLELIQPNRFWRDCFTNFYIFMFLVSVNIQLKTKCSLSSSKVDCDCILKMLGLAFWQCFTSWADIAFFPEVNSDCINLGWIAARIIASAKSNLDTISIGLACHRVNSSFGVVT